MRAPSSLLMPALLICLFCFSAAALAEVDNKSTFALGDGDRVVFYGDSITQNGGYAQFVEHYARSRFPAWDLHFYNAGVGGDTVQGGGAGDIALRLERDVIRLRPTVVTLMLGMNDGRYRALEPAIRQAFRDGYRAIIARLRSALPEARLYLIRTSPFDDYSGTPDFGRGYDLALHELGEVVSALGQEHQLPVVDFGRPVSAGIQRVAAENRDLATQLLPDRVHPGPAAHLVMGATLLRAWQAPSLVTRVVLDAPAGAVVAAENTQVTALVATSGRLSWEQLDRALPLPLNYHDADIVLAQKAGADLEALDQQPLVVTGLPDARYELAIDDWKFGPFTAAELATGVNLARYHTPMRWQAYQVRWGTEGGHERQRVARSAQPAVAESLAAAEESAQYSRSRAAIPLPRKYTLQRTP